MVEDFTPGYMQRAMHLFPRQGDHDPWRNTQNYALDQKIIRHSPLEDGVLDFSNAPAVACSDVPEQLQEAETNTAV